MSDPCLVDRPSVAANVSIQTAPQQLRAYFQEIASNISASKSARGQRVECHINAASGALDDALTLYERFHRTNPELFPAALKSQMSGFALQLAPFICETVILFPGLKEGADAMNRLLYFVRSERDPNLVKYTKQIAVTTAIASESPDESAANRISLHRRAADLIRALPPRDPELKTCRRAVIVSAFHSTQERFNKGDYQSAKIFYDRATKLMTEFGLSAEYQKIASQFRSTFLAQEKLAARR